MARDGLPGSGVARTSSRGTYAGQADAFARWVALYNSDIDGRGGGPRKTRMQHAGSSGVHVLSSSRADAAARLAAFAHFPLHAHASAPHIERGSRGRCRLLCSSTCRIALHDGDAAEMCGPSSGRYWVLGGQKCFIKHMFNQCSASQPEEGGPRPGSMGCGALLAAATRPPGWPRRLNPAAAGPRSESEVRGSSPPNSSLDPTRASRRAQRGPRGVRRHLRAAPAAVARTSTPAARKIVIIHGAKSA